MGEFLITFLAAILLGAIGGVIQSVVNQRKRDKNPIPPPFPELYETINDFLDITFENGIYTAYVKESKHLAIKNISFLIPFSSLRDRIDNECIVQKEETIADISTHGWRSHKFISPSKGIRKIYSSSEFFNALIIDCNKPLFELNTNEEYIHDFERKIAQKHEQEEQQNREWEKWRVAQKIKEREQRYKLEKEVRQELIERGEIMPSAGRAHIPRDIVDAVYARDKGKCAWCGSTTNLQIDHIIPHSKGGADTLENLQILCQRCNLEKSNKIG